MLKWCIFLFGIVGTTTALDSQDCHKSIHPPTVCKYMSQFNKTYSDHTELKLRAHHIMAIPQYIKDDVEFGYTSRSDRFKHELKRNNVIRRPKIRQNIARHPKNQHKQLTGGVTRLPPIDWRDIDGVSFVTDVKNQGECGCCFAFAAAAVLEYWSKKHGNPKSLSVQHLMDCTSTSAGQNDGCDGGLMEYIFEYGSGHSIVLDSRYPFAKRESTCPNVQLLSHVEVSNWKVLERENDSNAEQQLEKILHKYGPVSVGVDSTAWDNYQKGIFKHSMCSQDIDHAVTIVGYTNKAWIVKNSWGTDWGDNGYIYLEKGHNTCGVAEYIAYITNAYPIIANRPSI